MFMSCRRLASRIAIPHQSTRKSLPLLLLAFIFLAWQLASGARNPERFGHPAASSNPVENSSSIPEGTVLPATLNGAISLKDAQRGQPIEARITQEVPLPSGSIPSKSTLKGSIMFIEKDTEGTGVRLTLKFNQIEFGKQTVSILTYLRAIASLRAVRSAQLPLAGADAGTPEGWGTTVQIGGDIRYGDGGAVRNRAKQKIGKGVRGGVLVRLSANPALGCDGPVNGDDHPQALWIFSSDACGVYDLNGVKFTHTGKSPPEGYITLHFEKDDMKLGSGTGLLLRVVPKS